MVMCGMKGVRDSRELVPPGVKDGSGVGEGGWEGAGAEVVPSHAIVSQDDGGVVAGAHEEGGGFLHAAEGTHNGLAINDQHGLIGDDGLLVYASCVHAGVVGQELCQLACPGLGQAHRELVEANGECGRRTPWKASLPACGR